MLSAKRTLLVIEDDEMLNEFYADHCREVLAKLPHIDGTVRQAFNYSQAETILQQQPVDFISVDIALSQEEEDKTDEQRAQQEAGGMLLLKQLERAQERPLAVIVTGEKLQSYALDAYQKYGVLAFYQKVRFNIDEYKHAVTAALCYLDAIELLEKPEIEAAAESWKKTLASAEIAGIKEQQFPEPLGEILVNRWTHAVTGLPMGRWTEEKLRNWVVERQDWALIRVSIKGFSDFVSAYGSQEEPILSLMGELLRRAADKFQDQDSFIGHLGYLEAIPEPGFVIILGRQDMDRIAELATWIKKEFDQRARLFLPAFGRSTNPHQLTLSIDAKTLQGTDYSFEDLHRLLDTLGSA